ncbi:unnamed protein product [Didymodactylos carnosus]|uniref:TLDc domain-containing protein n=1 Tax=Didymodactylos carnosus TaxID=1234261 RepID=A0A815DK53_9BILA|nr:unnamed protein product [Didymodactylos carnosus]CAF1297553.1 unnamed protein product [Didymodactylos carnosus]CAF3914962.1 unnamed protein product [Didymodactylos carnosus]CAF4114883.1 unnamed protein product [Didymodactylos carnosus]
MLCRISQHQLTELFIGGKLLTSEYQQKLNAIYGKPNQNWELIYKATRDGFRAEDFHRSSDDKGPTMTVIQAKLGNYLFGGFTSRSWSVESGHKNDSKAFLFTLTNPDEEPPTKFLIKPSETAYAVYHSSSLGPVFGYGYDIGIYSMSNKSDSGSYSAFPSTYNDTTGKGKELFTGSSKLHVKDIEVYKIYCYDPSGTGTKTDVAVKQQQLFIGSSLLTSEYQQKLNAIYGKPNQNWELIYKATRDGFRAEDFHRSSDDKGPTMTVIQAKLGNYLFGGFTSRSWSVESGHKNDSKAFLFTLTNPDEEPPTKFLIKPSETAYAVYHSSSLGPVFGYGYDIGIYSMSNKSDSGSYSAFPSTYNDTTGKGKELFTGSSKLHVKDIEVYKIYCYDPSGTGTSVSSTTASTTLRPSQPKPSPSTTMTKTTTKTTTLSTTQNKKCTEIIVGIQFNYHDHEPVSMKTNVQKPEVCRDQCELIKDCIAWTYYPWAKSCFFTNLLKAITDVDRDDREVVSGRCGKAGK